MSAIVHKVTLQNEKHFGTKLPLEHLGRFFSELPQAIRATVSMAFLYRSQTKGPRPNWLKRASDVRFVDHQGNGESVLFFEALPLGEAAAEIYSQSTFAHEWEDRPSPEDTAFDLFGDVLTDVGALNTDSSHYDPSLLRRITRFKTVFHKGPYTEIDFTSRRFPGEHPVRFNPGLIASAQSLLGGTPPPRRVRIVGQLDGLEASTQRFSLLLDSGEKLVGNFAVDQAETVRGLWSKRVLVTGTAIYRASGKLLRIDAEWVKPGEGQPSVFTRMPAPPGGKLDVSQLRKPQSNKSGMSAIIGRWPGDETEEEIATILEELS